MVRVKGKSTVNYGKTTPEYFLKPEELIAMSFQLKRIPLCISILLFGEILLFKFNVGIVAGNFEIAQIAIFEKY